LLKVSILAASAVAYLFVIDFCVIVCMSFCADQKQVHVKSRTFAQAVFSNSEVFTTKIYEVLTALKIHVVGL
jgi:nucleoside phosphorylase